MKRRRLKPRRLNRKKARILQEAIDQSERRHFAAYQLKVLSLKAGQRHEAQVQADRFTQAFLAVRGTVRELLPPGAPVKAVVVPLRAAESQDTRPWNCGVLAVQFDVPALLGVWSQTAARLGFPVPVVVPAWVPEGQGNGCVMVHD